MIKLDFYEKLVAEIGDSRLRYCPLEHIHEFFVANQHSPPYILVSAASDYGLAEQAEHHPNNDLLKLNAYVRWEEAMKQRGGYVTVPIGPACDPHKCDNRHKYSVKINAWTLATFDEVPDNCVRWYCTNVNVNHPKIKWLPFGLNNSGDGSDRLASHIKEKPNKLLYVNFQDNTLDRIAYKRYFDTQAWATTRMKVGLPVDEFFDELADHRFVLCPFGNGWDCYRTYETLYLGRIPVLLDSPFARNFLDADLPVLVINSFYGLRENLLRKYADYFAQKQFDRSYLEENFWRGEFERSLANL